MEASVAQPTPLPAKSAEAGEPATVELDLTTSPESWERSPSSAADPHIDRSTFRLNVDLARLLRFDFVMQDRWDRQMRATLQFVLLVISALGVGVVVWLISRSELISILIPAIVLVTGVAYVRTAPRKP